MGRYRVSGPIPLWPTGPMRRIPIEELADQVKKLEVCLPKQRVLLTRKGKPFAIVSDASIYDDEDIGYMTSSRFWKMIEQRRREPSIPLEEVKARLGLGKKAPAHNMTKRHTGIKRKT